VVSTQPIAGLPGRSLCTAALVTGLAVASPAGGAPPPGTAPVREAWAAREAKLRRVAIVWEETCRHTPGCVSIFDDALAAAGPAPPLDATHTHECRLTLDGHKFRFTGRATLWNVDSRRFELGDYEAAYDGAKTYSRRRDAGPAAWPDPTVRTGLRSDWLWDYRVPLLLALRAGDAKLLPKYDLAECTVGDRAVRHDGRDCLELVWTAAGGGSRRVLVDPAAEHAIVLMEAAWPGGQRARGTVRYHRDGPQAGFPRGWTYETFFRDRLLRQYDAAVKTLTLDPDLPPEPFALTADK
jgi:hypothetical protein